MEEKRDKRDSIVFYRSYFEAIENCPIESQLNIYRAIMLYGLNGETLELSGIESVIFKMAKLNLDNYLVNDLRFSPKVENNKESVKKKTASVFLPPTREDVLKYFSENRFQSDGNAFFDYYQSNGWMVGNSKMKNWQSAANNWERREPKLNNASSQKKFMTPDEMARKDKNRRDVEYVKYFAEKLGVSFEEADELSNINLIERIKNEKKTDYIVEQLEQLKYVPEKPEQIDAPQEAQIEDYTPYVDVNATETTPNFQISAYGFYNQNSIEMLKDFAKSKGIPAKTVENFVVHSARFSPKDKASCTSLYDCNGNVVTDVCGAFLEYARENQL